jgi:hypothetical protein
VGIPERDAATCGERSARRGHAYASRLEAHRALLAGALEATPYILGGRWFYIL